MADILVEQEIKLLIIACNTATTAALNYLQQHFSHIPVIGVVKPGAQTAVQTTKTNEVAVLATETTINSRIYEHTIHSLNPNIKVNHQACGLFVALAEEGCINDDIAKLTIKKYLKPFIENNHHCDCIVLGCTHFPVLQAAIQAYVGKDISVVDSAHATAKVVTKILQEKQLLSETTIDGTQFFVTDQPERFARLGEIFYGEPIDAKRVELIDVVYQ